MTGAGVISRCTPAPVMLNRMVSPSCRLFIAVTKLVWPAVKSVLSAVLTVIIAPRITGANETTTRSVNISEMIFFIGLKPGSETIRAESFTHCKFFNNFFCQQFRGGRHSEEIDLCAACFFLHAVLRCSGVFSAGGNLNQFSPS